MDGEAPAVTQRLQLRRLVLADAALMLAVWNDPAFLRHVGDRGIRTLDDARQALADGALQMYEDYGYGPYRLALRADDQAVGICGLFRRKGLADVDIGYSILPAYCGLGYAFEAATAVLGYARDVLGLRRITAIVSPGNLASIGLIRKLGMNFERQIRLPGEDGKVHVYAMALGQAQAPR